MGADDAPGAKLLIGPPIAEPPGDMNGSTVGGGRGGGTAILQNHYGGCYVEEYTDMNGNHV